VKVATWNVNSLRARFDRLKGFLGRHAPDVVCLQETKLEDSAFPVQELAALGYESVFFGQRTYNGVAILAKETPSDVIKGFGDLADDPQCRFLAVRVGNLRIASLYVPNGGEVGSDKFLYKLSWMARWRAWLSARPADERPHLLCGDFNVAPEDRDVHDPVAWKDQVLCHPDERKALTAVREVGYEDVFRRHHDAAGLYSWWDYRMLGFPKNRGLRIDHVYARRDFAAASSSCLIDREERKGKLPSDHAPVLVELAAP